MGGGGPRKGLERPHPRAQANFPPALGGCRSTPVGEKIEKGRKPQKGQPAIGWLKKIGTSAQPTPPTSARMKCQQLSLHRNSDSEEVWGVWGMRTLFGLEYSEVKGCERFLR